MNIAYKKLFIPAQEHDIQKDARSQFLKIIYSNKGIDAISISNVLHVLYKKVLS